MANSENHCSFCKAHPRTGCSKVRLKFRAEYDSLVPPQPIFSGSAPAKPHELEGMNLDEMRQRLQELRSQRSGRQAQPVKAKERRSVSAVPMPQFSGAPA